MKKHLIFLSFLVTFYQSPANAMYYLVYKGYCYVDQKYNFSSESYCFSNDFSKDNESKIKEGNNIIKTENDMNNPIALPIKNVVKEDPEKHYDYSVNPHENYENYYDQKEIGKFGGFDKLEDLSHKEYREAYKYKKISFKKNLADISWKLDLYKKGQIMNLDLIKKEFDTMIMMRHRKTIKNHENAINQIFNEIDSLQNKKYQL